MTPRASARISPGATATLLTVDWPTGTSDAEAGRALVRVGGRLVEVGICLDDLVPADSGPGRCVTVPYLYPLPSDTSRAEDHEIERALTCAWVAQEVRS